MSGTRSENETLDSCGVCSGGVYEHIADSDKDCAGVCFGDSVPLTCCIGDLYENVNCNDCGYDIADGACDCAGTSATLYYYDTDGDSIGCDGTDTTHCVDDGYDGNCIQYFCPDEVPNRWYTESSSDCDSCEIWDECGVCGNVGAIYECGCHDIPEGECDCAGNVVDECGVCNGDGIADGDCDCAGNVEDACGVCGGGETTCSGCTDSEALNFNEYATVDNGTCEYVCNGCGTELAPIPILGNGTLQSVAWVGSSGDISQVNDIYYQDVNGTIPQTFADGTVFYGIVDGNLIFTSYTPSLIGTPMDAFVWMGDLQNINYGNGIIIETLDSQTNGYWIF